MPTANNANKIDRFFEALEKNDKNELLHVIKEEDLSEISSFVARLRRSLRVQDMSQLVEIELGREDDSEEQDEVCEEEQKELSKLYGERAKTAPQGFIKYEGPQQLKERILKNKEKKGWKFKNEQ
jgi:hypothetical protein